MNPPVYGRVGVPVGVTVGLGVAAGGLGVASVAVGDGAADGAVVRRGVAVRVPRPDGEAGGRLVGGAGTAELAGEWVAEWAGARAVPPTCAAVSGRTST
jgi:hypothetical protein